MHFISPVLWQFLVKWMTNFALFPAEASTIAPYTDALYFFLILISLVGLVLVAILVFGFSVAYRAEKNPVAVRSRVPLCWKPPGPSFPWDYSSSCSCGAR